MVWACAKSLTFKYRSVSKSSTA
uniref:Uncharacterized protein n=1 Tax=Anguilla anguilla TaxID=7936 RepID=A0A0E9R3S2_ANGAN